MICTLGMSAHCKSSNTRMGGPPVHLPRNHCTNSRLTSVASRPALGMPAVASKGASNAKSDSGRTSVPVQRMMFPGGSPVWEKNSRAKRVFPVPDPPITSAARATRSRTHSSRSDISKPSSRSRPTSGLTCPPTLRGRSGPAPPVSANSRATPSTSPTTKRPGRRRRVVSSIRTVPACWPCMSAGNESIRRPTGTRARKAARPDPIAILASGSMSRSTRAARATCTACSRAVPTAGAVTRKVRSMRRSISPPSARMADSNATTRSGLSSLISAVLGAVCQGKAARGPRRRSRTVRRESSATGRRPNEISNAQMVRSSDSLMLLGRSADGGLDDAVSSPRSPRRRARARNSPARTLADRGRAPGSAASMRWMISSSSGGTFDRRDDSGATVPVHTFCITSAALSPVKGGSPVSASYNTQPREKISARPSTSWRPRACSGAA